MSFLESIITAVFVMVVVFTVLASLYVLFMIFSSGIRKFESIGKKSTE